MAFGGTVIKKLPGVAVIHCDAGGHYSFVPSSLQGGSVAFHAMLVGMRVRFEPEVGPDYEKPRARKVVLAE